jgi:surface protein
MAGMFGSATSFNQPLYSWDVSSVQYMHYMFQGATAFNQNLSGWNVALTPTRPSLTRALFAVDSPLDLPENSNNLPLFV